MSEPTPAIAALFPSGCCQETPCLLVRVMPMFVWWPAAQEAVVVTGGMDLGARYAPGDVAPPEEPIRLSEFTLDMFRMVQVRARQQRRLHTAARWLARKHA